MPNVRLCFFYNFYFHSFKFICFPQRYITCFELSKFCKVFGVQGEGANRGK
jgi:hypothetical protein